MLRLQTCHRVPVFGLVQFQQFPLSKANRTLRIKWPASCSFAHQQTLERNILGNDRQNMFADTEISHIPVARKIQFKLCTFIESLYTEKWFYKQELDSWRHYFEVAHLHDLDEFQSVHTLFLLVYNKTQKKARHQHGHWIKKMLLSRTVVGSKSRSSPSRPPVINSRSCPRDTNAQVVKMDPSSRHAFSGLKRLYTNCRIFCAPWLPPAKKASAIALRLPEGTLIFKELIISDTGWQWAIAITHGSVKEILITIQFYGCVPHV